MSVTVQTPPIVVAALYKFVTLNDFEALREPLRQTMLDNDVKARCCSPKRALTARWRVAAKVSTHC